MSNHVFWAIIRQNPLRYVVCWWVDETRRRSGRKKSQKNQEATIHPRKYKLVTKLKRSFSKLRCPGSIYKIRKIVGYSMSKIQWMTKQAVWLASLHDKISTLAHWGNVNINVRTQQPEIIAVHSLENIAENSLFLINCYWRKTKKKCINVISEHYQRY